MDFLAALSREVVVYRLNRGHAQSHYEGEAPGLPEMLAAALAPRIARVTLIPEAALAQPRSDR